jgi:hypothetical protein
VIIALTYVAASLTLGILLVLAGRQRHKIIDGTDVFRYPSALLNVVAIGTPVYGVLAALIYLRPPPGPRTATFVATLAIVFGAFMIGNTLAYFFFITFHVETNKTSLTVARWGQRKTIQWNKLAIISLIEGRKGGRELKVLNRENRVILKVSSTIEDFDDLVWALKNYTRSMGVLVRERDQTGKWSESANV